MTMHGEPNARRASLTGLALKLAFGFGFAFALAWPGHAARADDSAARGRALFRGDAP